MIERKRLVWVALSLFGLFSLLIIRFYKIQIIEGEKWTKVAASQHQNVVVEPFKRGLFYSNTSIKPGHPEKPQPFVVDVPKFHLFADPLSIPEVNRPTVVSALSNLLQLNSKDQAKLAAQFSKKSRSRKLVMWLARDLRDKVQEWWGPYAKKNKLASNALFFVQDYKRSYPYGKLLGQVLHTVREDRDAKTQDLIPTGGLEMVFNKYLKGKPGKRVILRSPRHPLDTDQLIEEPENGADIYLTINHCLQAIAEEEIEKAVVKANAKAGWAIMMDPRTGEILALAQYPFFDPSRYSHYFNDPKLLEQTKIKALTDPFEPGSTFKPITIAIGMKANQELQKQGKKPIFSLNEKINTANGHFPGRSKPIRDTHFHKVLNMELAIQKSSNIYMARIVERVINTLGASWYRSVLQDTFGFGVKTGIELPSETIGLLPTPGKKHPNGKLEWSVPTPFSISFGHNILTNTFQMLRAYAILANGGYDVKPTILRKIVKDDQILLDNTTPERVQAFPRVLDQEIAEAVVNAMKYATKMGGTARRADVPGYTEAGKTATAEKIVGGTYSKTVNFSNFIGFAPAKNARFVLFVGIDEPEAKYIPGEGKNQMGGMCAAPAFREISLRSLQYLGVEPDDPNNKDWLDKVKQAKELYESWN